MTTNKLLLRGGLVFNSSRRELEQRDLRVEAGLITETSSQPGEEGEEGEGWEVVDCQGLLVLPGLIDLHVHVYHAATVLGVEPDSACLARGVTTVLDGGSAGAMTFAGLQRSVGWSSPGLRFTTCC